MDFTTGPWGLASGGGLELLISRSIGVNGREACCTRSRPTSTERLNHRYIRYIDGWLIIDILFHRVVFLDELVVPDELDAPDELVVIGLTLFYDLTLCVVLFVAADDDQLAVTQDL